MYKFMYKVIYDLHGFVRGMVHDLAHEIIHGHAYYVGLKDFGVGSDHGKDFKIGYGPGSRPWTASFVIPGDPEAATGSPVFEYGSQVANLESTYKIDMGKCFHNNLCNTRA